MTNVPQLHSLQPVSFKQKSQGYGSHSGRLMQENCCVCEQAVLDSVFHASLRTHVRPCLQQTKTRKEECQS